MSDGILNHKGIRKAYASKDDDATLTRFVKTGEVPLNPRRERIGGSSKVKEAADESRTLFPSARQEPNRRMLVGGHNNIKIGRDVRKGKLFRGYWIYTLSFEERATCPRSCHHWGTCYGNNMPFAKRVNHRDTQKLFSDLVKNVEDLLSVRGRVGVLVRLHALGDFFSPHYVRLWSGLLDQHDNLACFGYTAHGPKTGANIGQAIAEAKERHGRRFAIRWSGRKKKDAAVPFVSKVPEGVIACPEQYGATTCCATCALCWETDKPIGFKEH